MKDSLCPSCVLEFLKTHKLEDLGDEIPSLHHQDQKVEYELCPKHWKDDRSLEGDLAEAIKVTKPMYDELMRQFALPENAVSDEEAENLKIIHTEPSQKPKPTILKLVN